jgi:hypothetical protein
MRRGRAIKSFAYSAASGRARLSPARGPFALPYVNGALGNPNLPTARGPSTHSLELSKKSHQPSAVTDEIHPKAINHRHHRCSAIAVLPNAAKLHTMFAPFITIAIQCHNYQKRLCWMLSSLAEQAATELFIVDVAHIPENGSPSTPSIIALFGSKLNIKSSVWDDYAIFQKRGFVRNRQLQECSTEWILFSDCDMVYHPEYFSRLQEELETKHARAKYMLSAGRFSTTKESANELVNSTVRECPAQVLNAYARAEALPKALRSNVGAGFSQLINVKNAPHGGYYVAAESNADWSWSSRFHKTRSDLQFRKRIGRLGGSRRKLPEWFSMSLIHLNHNRDKEFSRHLEEQR